MKLKEFAQEVQRTLPDLHELYCTPQEDGYFKSIGGLHYVKEITGDKDVRVTNHTSSFHILNQVHMRLGIAGELDELMTALHKKDNVNIGEELADMLWYVCNDIRIKVWREHILQADFNMLTEFEFVRVIMVTNGGFLTHSGNDARAWFNAITFNASKLVDYVKKDLAYGKAEPPREEYNKTILYLLGAINNLAFDLKIDLEFFMGAVIEKLRIRYPGKFSATDAINRNLDAERKVLEGENPS